MRDGIRAWDGESALSEVVGFVLIIALIIGVFSLYLTYGVPAQGRESEILHMNTVKDQFVDYKIGLDSLANNNKVGTTVSNSFTLGTEGGFTRGMMSFIPIVSPVQSSGTISINRRTTSPETLNITSVSLIRDPANTSARTSFDLPTVTNYTPDHVYITVTGIGSSDLGAGKRFGATVQANSWEAFVNLTPVTSLYKWYMNYPGLNNEVDCQKDPRNTNGTPIFLGSNMCLVPMNDYAYNGTDISLSVKRGGILVMDNYPLYRNVQAGTLYTFDLMDPAYGLSTSVSANETIVMKNDHPLGTILATGNVTYDFREQTYTIDPIPLGAVAYTAKNNYWISQDYYYQMGGVFLSQVDGNDTYKLPPSITFSVDDTELTRRIINVNIAAVRITDPYGGSIVGGNSPVQIKTTLNSVYTFPFAAGTANTKNIRIAVNTSDDQARIMWRNYFNYTARVADLPPGTEVGISGTEAYIHITGFDTTPEKGYDINVAATNATYTAQLFGVGG